MDEFNSHINDAPMRKNMPVRSLKIRIFDKSKKPGWNDKDVFVNIRTRTSSTIKKSYLSYEASGGKMRYGSHSAKCHCCSQERRVNADRANFKRLIINPEIREQGQDQEYLAEE